MNKKRNRLYPENFPKLTDLKHDSLEKKVKVGLKYSFPDNYNIVPVETAEQLLYMISKYTRFGFFKAPFFVGKWIDFSPYNRGIVRVSYYLFNHETAFSYLHEIKIPNCPVCGSNQIFMMNDGSFRCNNHLGNEKYCKLHLPNPENYSAAMQVLAEMQLRDVIQKNSPMVKQLVWVDDDVLPYMIMLIEKTEHLKLTLVNEAKDRKDGETKNAIYFDVESDFDIGTI